MSDQKREYDDDAYSEQFAVDISDESVDTDSTETSRDKEDYKALRAEFDALKEMNSQLLSKVTERPVYQAPIQDKKPQGIDENTLEALGKNPKALAEYVRQSIDSGLSDVRNEQQKAHFEQKLQEDFPALKTNKKFEEATIAQIRELVATGEYQPNSPRLVYRAAQLAAAKMGDSVKKNETQNRDTSLAPSSSSRGVTRGSSSGSLSIKDNDPRLAFAVAAGMNDPKKLAKFKKELAEGYGSTEEHMSKRGQLNPRGRKLGGGRR